MENKNFRQQIEEFSQERFGMAEIYPGFLDDQVAVKKMWEEEDAHVSSILTNGIRTRTELCFIIERINLIPSKRSLTVKGQLGLLKTLEQLLSIEAKNKNWFMEDLYRHFPPIPNERWLFKYGSRRPTEFYKNNLDEEIKIAIHSLSRNNLMDKGYTRLVQQCLFFLVWSADFIIPESLFQDITPLLRTGIKPPGTLFSFVEKIRLFTNSWR